MSWPRRAAIGSLVLSIVGAFVLGITSLAGLAVALRSWQWSRGAGTGSRLAVASIFVAALGVLVSAGVVLAISEPSGAGGLEPDPNRVWFLLTTSAVSVAVGVIALFLTPPIARMVGWLMEPSAKSN